MAYLMRIRPFGYEKVVIQYPYTKRLKLHRGSILSSRLLFQSARSGSRSAVHQYHEFMPWVIFQAIYEFSIPTYHEIEIHLRRNSPI